MSTQTDYENSVRDAQNANEAVFEEWPKTPRLFRDIVVTEKIDGTNACVVVPELNGPVYAQSRKKIILPSSDNFGFARWVFEHRDFLREVLGPGRHFGEWYGSGIQRGYGLRDGIKKFMLFNTARWTPETVSETDLDLIGVEAATVLYEGPFSENAINLWVDRLRENGSKHRPEFQGKAEGVCVFHTQSRQVYKVMCEHDEIPKGLVEA